MACSARDLYHRLNVIRIELPPLRARSEDIPDLLAHYLTVAAHELGVEPKSLSKDAERGLAAYAWAGNVRELVNLCRRLTVLAPGTEISVEDLPPELGATSAAGSVDADWAKALATWADRHAMNGKRPLLDEAQTRVRAAYSSVRLSNAPRGTARRPRSYWAGVATPSRASSRSWGWTRRNDDSLMG